MDRLSEYVIKHSSCCMPRCEYVENDIEIDCDKCQEIMIQEHDKQIRADAIDDVLNLDRYKFGVTMLNAEEYIKVSDIKQLKEQK